MVKFNIQLFVEDFLSLVGPLNLKREKGGYAFIAAKLGWLKLIEKPIAAYERDVNGSLDLNDQLQLNKGRYYPESKRSKFFLVMYLKCKKCNDLVYTVTIERKPEQNEPIVFEVERNVEHDLIRHSLASAIRGDKRILPRRLSRRLSFS